MNNHNGNGAAEPALPQATELVLSNGIKLWAYPISRVDYRALIDQWLKENPEPDKTAFEKELNEEMASYPGQKLPAEENPEYHALVQARREHLNAYMVRAYLIGYTDFNFAPEQTEEILIERFKRMIAQKRRVLELPADEWEATVQHGIIQLPQEKQQIIHAVENTLPVTEEEVADGMRIFRPVTKQHPARTVPNRRSKTPSPEAEAEPQPSNDESPVQ